MSVLDVAAGPRFAALTLRPKTEPAARMGFRFFTSFTAMSCPEVAEWLESAGCVIARRTGVRVVFHYVAAELQSDEMAYQRLLELEGILGSDPKYVDFAVIMHVLARRT